MTSVAVKPGDRWRPVRGYVHGLRQSSSIGELAIDADALAGLPLLESALPDLVDEPLPDRPEDQRQDARLLELFVFMVGAIQREGRIAAGHSFHATAQRVQKGHWRSYYLWLPSPNPGAFGIALQWAADTCNLLLGPGDREPSETLEALHALRNKALDDLQPFASVIVNKHCILLAADRLGVPVLTLDKDVLQLGTGCHSRLMQSSMTDATSAVGAQLAWLKNRAARVLRSGGLPGAVHGLVRTADEAVVQAGQLGYPVVVKPADRERGLGVSADLRDEQAVREAWEIARAASSQVLVEKWVAGATHRLTVFQDEVIRVSRRTAGGVTGDGVHSVAELVTLVQQTPQPGGTLRRDRASSRLALDAEATGLLQQEGLDAAHVPAAGNFVRLRRRDNMNAGGSSETLPLDQVHPDNLRVARDAARLLRLDFAGIDLITSNIGSSWLETEALICEVNAKPQMRARREPEAWDRVVLGVVGERSRIPAHLVIVPDDQNFSQGFVAQIAQAMPGTPVSCRAGLWLNGQRASMPFADGFVAAQALLKRSDVTAATCLMSLSELEQMGLPLDQWDSIRSAVRYEPASRQERRLRAVMAMARANEKKES